MKRSARVSIHPEALQNNLLVAKKTAPKSNILAVIKANAYGHGAVTVAGILYDLTDAFAVSCISEAVELREAGIDKPITVLQGHQNTNDLHIAAHHDFRVVIHEDRQLSDLNQYSGKHRFKVNLKIDTGMHRLGFRSSRTESLFTKLKNCQQINPDQLILMTHLCCADELVKETTTKQIDKFTNSCKEIDVPQSIANSAGILGWPKSHVDWIRPGIMLYGSSPIEKKSRDELDLQAAMTLHAPVIAVHTLKKGNSIGYGSTWKCPTDMQVAVIACGYADGYPRHTTSGTPVWIKGKETQLLGRVSMDMIVIDANEFEESPIQVGDEAELWGANLSVDKIAEGAETIAYELLCNAGNLSTESGT